MSKGRWNSVEGPQKRVSGEELRDLLAEARGDAAESPAQSSSAERPADQLREPVTPPEMEGKVPQRQAKFSEYNDGGRVDMEEIRRLKKEIQESPE